ncbi:Splicing factor 3B subunit 1 [Galdieria sulphuraria]|nr:Splicing factor 3B subunit 1 [Galdieria sulphuraria]
MSKPEQLVNGKGTEFGKLGSFDTHIYDTEEPENYVSEIPPDNLASDSEEDSPKASPPRSRFGPSKEFLEEAAEAEIEEDEDPFKDTRRKSIVERENEYQSKARSRGVLS